MDNPPNWLRRLGAGIAVAFVATCASTATATTIVTEPFGPGWTPGTTWATSGSYTPEVATDNAQTPASAMRLTPASPASRAGLLSYTIPQPTSGGLDIRFKFAQWDGITPVTDPPLRTADGLAFFLRKGSETSNAAGFFGASLGYAPYPGGSVVGLAGGLLGVGFDQWGGYTQSAVDGTNCAGLGQAGPGSQNNTIGIRGAGNGTTGYCFLGRTTAGAVQFGGGTDSRGGRARSVRITVDPATQANPKITVYYGATASTEPTQVLQVNAPADLLAEPTFRFGFTGSTGANTQNNEVWDLQVSSLVSLPAIEITTMSLPGGTVGAAYAATTIATTEGVAPITFAVSSGSLPPGLSLDPATGTVSGTPTKSGTYSFTVAATDSRGPTASTASRAYSITVADSAPPCTPVELVATAGVGSATLSWTADPAAGCAGITGYQAELESGQSCSASPPTTTCTISDLPVGTPVRFRVRALNAIGASAWSAQSAEATPIAGATFVRAAGGRSVVLMRVRVAQPGRLIVSGARGANWKTRAITPRSIPVPRPGMLNITSALTPATKALLRTRSVQVRLAVTAVSPSGSRTTSYRTITLRRVVPPPVTG